MRLFFVVPYGGLPVYLFPVAAMAERFKRSGYEIHWLRCREGLRESCIVHYTLSQEHCAETAANTCDWCLSYQNEILEHSGFSGATLTPFHAIGDGNLEPEILARLSAYQLLIKHKLLTIADLEKHHDEEWQRYQSSNRKISSSVLAQLLTFDKQNTVLIVLHSLYSTSAVLKQTALQAGYRALSVNLGYSVKHLNESLSMTAQDQESSTMALARWYETKSQNLKYSEEEVERFLAHSEAGLGKLDVKNYSLGKAGSVASLLNRIPSFARYRYVIVVAASSNDEIAASEVARNQGFGTHPQAIFSGQREWIDGIVSFATQRPDYLFIVRPHPRELRYQDGGHWNWLYSQSAHLDNVCISDDALGVSGYDLLDIADLVLVSISSMGLEAQSVGIPVLSIWPGQTCWPLPHQAQTVTSSRDYFDWIDQRYQSGTERDPVLSEWALEFGVYLLAAGSAYFSHQDFWSSSRQALDPEIKSKRRALNLPLLSYEDYFSRFSMSDSEFSKLEFVVREGREMHEAFNESSERTLDAGDIKRRYAGLWRKYTKESHPLNKTARLFGI